MDKNIKLGELRNSWNLDPMNISFNNYIPVARNVATKCTNLRN